MPVLKVKSLRSGRVYVVYESTGSRFLIWKNGAWHYEPIEFYAPLESGTDENLHNAIRLLEQEYEIAKEMDFVYNPIAWSLYRVWKKMDEGRNTDEA